MQINFPEKPEGTKTTQDVLRLFLWQVYYNPKEEMRQLGVTRDVAIERMAASCEMHGMEKIEIQTICAQARSEFDIWKMREGFRLFVMGETKGVPFDLLMGAGEAFTGLSDIERHRIRKDAISAIAERIRENVEAARKINITSAANDDV